SPALIEKVRSAVTDNQGQYKIVDLRPGVYTVTFTLPGFRTVRREGIELSGAFTAAGNAEMQVGALAETITVSGQGSMVDVQNAVQQRVITSAIIDQLPTGKTMQNFVVLIPGALIASKGSSLQGHDVGGIVGDQNVTVSIHGSSGDDM